MQVSVLFSWMDDDTRLRKLNIRGNSLKSVPPDLLAKLLNRYATISFFLLNELVTRLEEANVWSTCLSGNQVLFFFSLVEKEVLIPHIYAT